MVRYGKTRRAEARNSEAAEEDLSMGSRPRAANRAMWFWSLGGSVVLFFSLGFMYSDRWFTGVTLLAFFAALLFVRLIRELA